MSGSNYFYIAWNPTEAVPHYWGESRYTANPIHKKLISSSLSCDAASSKKSVIPQQVSDLNGSKKAFPEGVIRLDKRAQAHGFKAGVIESIYTRILRENNENDTELLQALEKGEGEFIRVKEGGNGKSKSYLQFPDRMILGVGTMAKVQGGFTQDGAPCAIRQPKEVLSNKGKRKSRLSSLFRKHIMHLQERIRSFANNFFSKANDPHKDLKGAPHIIQRFGAQGDYSVFERGESGLNEHVSQNFGMNKEENFEMEYVVQPEWMLDLVEGIAELNAVGYVQPDLKTDNVILVNEGRRKVLKLIDLNDCQVLTPKGEWAGGLKEGNVVFFSPERRALAVGQKGSYGSVGKKDNVWGVMDLLCRMSEYVTSPSLKLSPLFFERFKQYDKWSLEANTYGKEAMKKYLKGQREKKGDIQDIDLQKAEAIYREAFHKKMLEQFELGCGGGISPGEENLFFGLTPQNPFDQLIMDMAYLNSGARISIDETEERLRALIPRRDSV